MKNISTIPGKFEGEHLIIESLWAIVLQGGADASYFASDEETEISVVSLTLSDWKQYPELRKYDRCEMWEAENGFIFADFY